ncbi:MAG: hypothetical protein E4H17_02630 [Gemmatimonadales bacterium]|nr:MAG: hypothetical protein E4H17_02630 [Gemmatimonadales bacterium]
MTWLTEDQVEALRELSRFWPEAGLSLIGASALGCLMPDFHRHTYDLDVAVATSLNELPSELNQPSGWQRDTGHELRWLTPAGVKVDLIPAGRELLAAGQVTWPSGHVMSLRGFRHAFSSTCPVEVAPGFQFDVPTVPVITLLKVIAYQERPHERERDLGDIAFALDHFQSEDAERRYSTEILEAGIRYEEVSPYLLGRDLRGLVDEGERRSVMTFVALARGEADGGRTRILMLQQAPIPGWREHPEDFRAAIAAFERGLSEP